MLNFLRNLRRQEMKGTKYLKYALGEILLVVIGILIALAINNWNEVRKQKVKSLAYHQRINEDLTRLIAGSNAKLESATLILESINITVEALENGKMETAYQKEQVEYAMLWFSRSTYQLPDLSTYEEMKSNGELNLIFDVKLRNELADFSSYLLQVEKIHDRLSDAIERDFQVFNRHLRAHTNTESLEVTYAYNFDKMAQDREFINTYSRLAVHWRGFVFFMKRVNKIGMAIQKQLTEQNPAYAQLPPQP